MIDRSSRLAGRWVLAVVLIVASLFATGLGMAAGASTVRTALASSTSAPKNCDNAALVGAPSGSAGWIPVVLVHGFSSSASMWQDPKASRSMVAMLDSNPDAAVYTFDYSRYSFDWVTSDAIGPALASSIDCLARRSGHKVVVIGHSMGGLAIQYAQGQTVSGRRVADELAQVITIGTPSTGWLFGSTLDKAQFAVAGANPGVWVVWQLCGLRATYAANRDICSFVGGIDTPAARAMRRGSRELAALPPFKAGLPVHRIAGQVDVLREVLWGTKTYSADDLVVSIASATAGGTDTAHIETCGPVDLTGVFSTSCFHTREAHDPAVIADVVASVARQTQGLHVKPVTAAELDSMTLPAGSCGPGVDPPGPYPLQNKEWHEPGSEFTVAIDSPTIGDLDGDGIDDGVVSYTCTSGAGTHFADADAMFARDRSIHHVELAADDEQLNDIASLAINNRTLQVEMRWRQGRYEPYCCPTRWAVGHYRYTNSTFSRTSIVVTDTGSKTKEFLDDVNRGDFTAASAMITQGADPAITDVAANFPTRFGPYSLYDDGCGPDELKLNNCGLTTAVVTADGKQSYILSWDTDGKTVYTLNRIEPVSE